MHTRHRKHCALSMLLAATNAAASDTEDAIERCAGASSAADRILCLEEALRQSPADNDNTDDTSAAAETSTRSEPVKDAFVTNEQQGAGDKPADPAVDRTAAASEPIPKVPSQTTPTDASLDKAGDETKAGGAGKERQQTAQSPNQAFEEFGLGAGQRDFDSLDSIAVTVVSVDSNVFGKLIFATESGQVWTQIDRATPRYRDMPFDAEIRRGAVGSFFIKPLAGGVAVRVRRVR